MKKIIILFSILFCASWCAQSQTNNTVNKLSDDFIGFFCGNWSGEGQFANGKKIAADLSFKLSLDSSWITYEHTDKLPNRYKALSMWGIDNTGQFTAYVFDNFRDHRQFVSDGWKDGKLVLTASEYYTQSGLVFQHFIYEKLSAGSFKMTYETSKDGISWVMKDYLFFNKK